jgi:hypothetical protein
MPQLESIAQLAPMARAPPAGRVFATALEPRLTTAASRSRMDGSTEQIMTQAQAMLAATAAASGAAGCLFHAGAHAEVTDQASDGKDPRHLLPRRGDQQVTSGVPGLPPPAR